MPSALWFNLNREQGSPAYHWDPNRTGAPFRYNAWFLGIVIVAGICLIILATLTPTLKHKCKTILFVLSSLFLGVVFILSSVIPEWQSGDVTFHAPIKIRDTETVRLRLGLHIGLHYANITLDQDYDCYHGNRVSSSAFAEVANSTYQRFCSEKWKRDIHFNEEIVWDVSDKMQESLKEALRRGLPSPILTVFDYFQHQDGGLCWSRDFRTAGYYGYFILIITISSWVITNVMFLIIPRYGTVSLMVTGILAIATVLVYWSLLPSRDLVIYLNGQKLLLGKGWCYWAVLVMGFAAYCAGAALFWLDRKLPGIITTDLELEQTARMLRLSQKKEAKENSKPSLKSRISVLDGTANVDNEKANLEKLRDVPDMSYSGMSSSSLIHNDKTESNADKDPRSLPSIDESPIPHFEKKLLFYDQITEDLCNSSMEIPRRKDPFVLETVTEGDEEDEDDISSSSSSSDPGGSDWGNITSSEGEFAAAEQNELRNPEKNRDLPDPYDRVTPRRRSARMPSSGSHQDFLTAR